MTLASALRTGDLTRLPSRRDEDWRWTDLRGLIRVLPPAAEAGAVHEAGPFSELGGDEIIIANGHVQGAADFVTVGGQDAILQLRHVATQASSNPSRFGITVRSGDSLLVLESYEAQADGAVTSADIDIIVEAGGSLRRIVLAADHASSITVSTATVSLAANAVLEQTVLTTGARRQRIETRVAHPGAGATVRLDGAYLLCDQCHADLTTVVTHGGVDGTTSQMTKGVVRDQARGVFQGRIVVERGADRTDARMGHHALIVSDRAEVDAKPELLIFADDVSCAHGNTIGALDEEAIFYARQRGIPADVARAMLTTAFVGEVIDRIEHDGARDIARAWAAQQLGTDL
ncbi:MAG: Fe-S cluster assembly protein SufD [Caulobacter sp.]|nr:Fe-S cluster assembly protein SufD [Caulobacter sp.]